MPVVKPEQLRAIFTRVPQWRLDTFTDEALLSAGINTPRRLRYFLAQLAHESGGLIVVEENLRYSPAALRRVFPKYFPTMASAVAFGYQPARIANRVYANRIGNGPESSGDGYRFRGRGLIQTTGRANYAALQADTGLECLANPDLLLTPEGAMVSAVSYWRRNRLNRFADAVDFIGLTKAINGGTHGHDNKPGGRLWWLDKIEGVI